MGLTKLLIETQLTCGPNEAPGRNKVYGLLPVGLTKLLVEAKLCGFLPVGLTKLLVKALSRGRECLWFYAF